MARSVDTNAGVQLLEQAAELIQDIDTTCPNFNQYLWNYFKHRFEQEFTNVLNQLTLDESSRRRLYRIGVQCQGFINLPHVETSSTDSPNQIRDVRSRSESVPIPSAMSSSDKLKKHNRHVQFSLEEPVSDPDEWQQADIAS